MTTSLSAALRMHRASVAAPAPLASGASAEPCSANQPHGKTGGTIVPAFGSRPTVGGGWDREDQAQIEGGGPLRR